MKAQRLDRTTPHTQNPKKSNGSKNTHQQKPTNHVRVIGGQLKRRQLSFIDGEGLRPTPDRLRETLFNWLMGYTQDARVLDVCAGSGVLGIESISRGATHATLIEANPTQSALIQTNAKTLQVTAQCTVIQGCAEQILPTLATPFDIIFVDPPYSLNLWQSLLSLITYHKLYHKDSLIYIEADKPLDDLTAEFELHTLKSAKIGQVYAILAQF